MLNLHQLRETEFALALSNQLHLNHAGISPLPNRTKRAIEHSLDGLATDPQSYFMSGIMPAMETARTNLAQLMGVTSADLALVKNTGHGLSIIADSLSLEPGDNVITVAEDYPSVVYPWLAQKSRGVETRVVAVKPDGSFNVDDVESKFDSRTRVLALSWVQFSSGYRISPRTYADLAHRHNALLVLDVIQGLGVHPLNAEAAQVDAVVTGAHKWLMSPSGTGALYVAPAMLDRMRLVNIGALSVKNFAAFDSSKFDLKDTAQRYEEGSPNGIGLVGLAESTSFLLECGIANIQDQILTLTDTLATGLTRLGFTVRSPRNNDEWSGLVMFSHNSKSNNEVLHLLEQRRIRAAIRGGYVRISPHFYNTAEDIALALEALAQ